MQSKMQLWSQSRHLLQMRKQKVLQVRIDMILALQGARQTFSLAALQAEASGTQRIAVYLRSIHAPFRHYCVHTLSDAQSDLRGRLELVSV